MVLAAVLEGEMSLIYTVHGFFIASCGIVSLEVPGIDREDEGESVRRDILCLTCPNIHLICAKER